MEMGDQYGMADLRQYINGRPIFPAISPPTDTVISGHHRSSLTAAQHYEMVMSGRQTSDVAAAHHGLDQELIHPDCTSNVATITTSIANGGSSNNSCFSGLEMEGGGLFAGDGGTGRWPRQETLTLLEIRSRLDSKFKEANQKGPLWDEVSRILSEEYGYQRSGKKCREKFENLYKYYKKTKEGKAGRQDGKHYRFFRQLEALYGDSSNTPSAPEPHFGFRYNAANINTTAPSNINQEPFQGAKMSDSVSLSHSSDFATTSSDDSHLNNVGTENDSIGKWRKRSKRNWKAKVKDFIDVQMRKVMDKQEAWLVKMMKTIEHREQERMMREEVWRKQEEARIEKEHSFWAKERAWIEARDTALMEALQKFTGKDFRPFCDQDSFPDAEQRSENGSNPNGNGDHRRSWAECELTRLIQLRTSMEPKFQQVGCSSEILWEEIAAKMASLGYERSPLMCKEKWNSTNDYLIKCNRSSNGKQNPVSWCYFQSHDATTNEAGAYSDVTEQGPAPMRRAQNDHSASHHPNYSSSNTVYDGGFRYFVGGDAAENLWDNNYCFKVCKGDNNL